MHRAEARCYLETVMKSRMLVVGMVVGLSFLGACSPQAKVQGSNGDTVATYHRMTLRANLPAESRVPAVMAAADQTLRARGYTIVRSSATEEKGEVVAHPPRSDNLPRLVIESERGVSSTIVDLRVEPFGDQDLCRSVLDGMLQRLGL
jgi:hypothetical protein